MSIDLGVVNDGVATVTINRAAEPNAKYHAAIAKAWLTAPDDPQIRCAILSGAGDKALSEKRNPESKRN